MAVALRTQNRRPIASISSALSEHDFARLRDDLAGQGRHTRARRVIPDARAVDALDSFATRPLHVIAAASRCRETKPVIVGVQREVAFATSRLGATLDDASTVGNLEAGLAFWNQRLETSHGRR